METVTINELQKSHLIELLTELKELADSFILIGGQALPYFTERPRPTKDIDFVLDVFALQNASKSIADVLNKLNYKIVDEARNFQFFKEINPELKVRIEFLAVEKEKRKNNIRVDVQKNIHARACTGAEIAIKESYNEYLRGFLPNGKPAEVKIRVVRPHALLMLKLYAMDDRYQNIRGPDEANHDRNESRIHSADIISVIHGQIKRPEFATNFWSQFNTEIELRERAKNIISKYYDTIDSPGIRLYAEFLQLQIGSINETELARALREMKFLLGHSTPKND